ncbi:MAG: hypothetical protein K2K48_05645 [Anaeroplasmataceae bacterium]|nr:hypothetical protein [Anaeroplasmataceae bacterium]MDE6414878.1 hypothetical protein [Anaeroplasmataceae bacterium]
MTRFLKNNAKIIYVIYGVFCFLWILLACIYITPFKDTLVQFTNAVLKNPNEIDYSNYRISDFCSNTNQSYAEYFRVMFDFNQKLQAVNNLMLTLGVVSLVTFAAMLICSNISRKKYYISNLVSGVAAPAINAILAIVVLALNFACIAPLNKNFDILNWGALANDDLRAIPDVISWYTASDTSHFVLNSTPLIIYGIVLIIYVLASFAMLAYNVYRYMDTRKVLSQEKVVGE